MSNSNGTNGNGKESPLVLIVNRNGSVLQVNGIRAGLGTSNYIVDTISYDKGAPVRHANESLPEVEILIAAESVPVRAIARAAPNLKKIITTNPAYRGVTSVHNGQRSVEVKYFYNPVSHHFTTREILQDLVPNYSEKPAAANRPQ